MRGCHEKRKENERKSFLVLVLMVKEVRIKNPLIEPFLFLNKSDRDLVRRKMGRSIQMR